MFFLSFSLKREIALDLIKINKDSNNYDKNVTKDVKTTVIKGDGYTRTITITTTKTKYTTKNNDNKNNNINNEINDNVQPIVEESKNE